MKINLIRISNSIDPKAPYLKDSEAFIEDLNNELFEYGHELVFNQKDAQFSIVFIETGGSEEKFCKIYKKLEQPIVLLSDSKNNSLAACFEIRTFLEQKGVSHTVLFGEEDFIAKSIDKLADMFNAKRLIDNSNLGVIGTPSDWLIASKCDYKKVNDLFKINVIDISMDELFEQIDKQELEKIPHKKELLNKYKDQEVLDGAFNIYSALKRIVKKYHLKGFTLRCFDLLNKYKNTACLAFALLNEEGIIATCEGDVPTLLTMYIIYVNNYLSSFQANPSSISLKDNTAIFSHCTIPLNMCEKYELSTHFESGLGIGVHGELLKKDVTVLKIKPDLKEILLLKGTIEENTSFKNYCRTQIKVKFDEDDIYELISRPFGNHMVIVYGDVIPSLLPILQIYKLIPKLF